MQRRWTRQWPHAERNNAAADDEGDKDRIGRATLPADRRTTWTGRGEKAAWQADDRTTWMRVLADASRQVG